MVRYGNNYYSVDLVNGIAYGTHYDKPVRFKIYDSGHWKSVNVERILNIEWMRLDGKVQIVYSCESRSCNGKMINYKLKYIHQDIRWEMEMDGPRRTSGRKIS